MKILEKIVTQDGSFTYRRSDTGATYRSINGAESESRHVFLEGTRISQRESPWRVLELGFGTGLNFEVTRRAAHQAKRELLFVSLEPDPLPPDLWLTSKGESSSLQIVEQRWQDYQPQAGFFQAGYHDPFGPGEAPECWEVECFSWWARALTPDGILATFGASGNARRALKKAGFYVGILPGARGKREMTVASQTAEAIASARPWKRHS